MACKHVLLFCKLTVRPSLHRVLLHPTQCTELQGPWVSVIELPGGVIHDSDFPISVLGVSMASKHFIDG